jgi:hypothetical protein
MNATGLSRKNLMEHRWGKRIDVDIPVRLHVSSRLREHSAHLANLSLSGGWTPISIGILRLSIIQVVFDLPLPPSSPRTVNAFVARQSQDGTGLEWCEHAPEVVVRLLQARARGHHIRIDRSPTRKFSLADGKA